MANEKSARMSLAACALGILRSRRLKRYAGADLSVIEKKVANYYASQEGAAYYSTLATQDIWEDMARHADFLKHYQTARDILDFGCGAGGLSVALSQHDPGKRIFALDIGAHAAAIIKQASCKVKFSTALREVCSWAFSPGKLTYLDPQISETTGDADDQDAVWLTNPVKICRLLKKTGFKIVRNWPTQSLVIARKN